MNVRKTGRVLFLCAFSAAAARAENLKLVLNPYEGVDWEKVTQHKANLHTHTVASGGKLFLNQVFEEYAKRGYTILAVTDHDICTRWDKAGVDPLKEYGILPVMGQEYSEGHHVNGLFLNYETRTRDTALLLREIAGHGGLAIINHPGRYWKVDAGGQVPQETREEYAKLLDENPLAVGLEVINKGNRNPHDLTLWDELLKVSMPVRPVWGFANDDMHESKQLGHSWDIFLLDTLDEAALRHAMLKGHFYFSSRGHDHEHDAANEPPLIQAIVHDPAARTLTLRAAADGAVLDAEHFRWIADGQTIGTGPVLSYGQAKGLGRYVRAEVSGKGGTTYTNPFGFSRALP